jgi:thiamine pyrophosphate-dependent acetolactate synthase large subunit-like protein
MIERFEATQYVTSKLTNELVVASLGNAKFDLFNAKDRPRNFYMWNSMGMACSFALGLAMARPQERVICLDGDGSLLMNLGSLATETVRSPKNFIHIVWDNRSYELTGKQPTATAYKTDLAKMAEGAGYASDKVERVESIAAFRAAFDKAMKSDGPWFILALVEQNRAKPPRPPLSPTYIKHRFMIDLGLQAT